MCVCVGKLWRMERDTLWRMDKRWMTESAAGGTVVKAEGGLCHWERGLAVENGWGEGGLCGLGWAVRVGGRISRGEWSSWLCCAGGLVGVWGWLCGRLCGSGRSVGSGPKTGCAWAGS